VRAWSLLGTVSALPSFHTTTQQDAVPRSMPMTPEELAMREEGRSQGRGGKGCSKGRARKGGARREGLEGRGSKGGAGREGLEGRGSKGGLEGRGSKGGAGREGLEGRGWKGGARRDLLVRGGGADWRCRLGADCWEWGLGG